MAGKIKGRRTFLLYLLAGLFLLSLLFNFYQVSLQLERNRVVQIYDGDSFTLSDGRKVRLLSVDAPDIDRCMGLEAKMYLESLIFRKRVSLKDTVEDDYGRLLSNVYASGQFVNAELVRQGLVLYHAGKSRESERLKEAQNIAKSQKLGIYSTLCRKTTPVSVCVIKGNIRAGNKIYHLPGCINYAQVIVDESFGDRWFCTEEEAQASGYLKSGSCPD